MNFLSSIYKSFSENKEYLCTINFKLSHQHEKSNLFFANRGGNTFMPCKAESYYLARSFDHHHQSIPSNSKAPARPVCIDITANVITVPKQLVGYTLTLSNGEDCCTYYIIDTTLSIPQGISGEYELTITNGSVSYQGDVEI